MGRFVGCGFTGFGGGFMFPFMWIGVILIILGVYMFYRILKTTGDSKDSSALDILNMKYANGEIDEESYLKKKNTISGKRKI